MMDRLSPISCRIIMRSRGSLEGKKALRQAFKRMSFEEQARLIGEDAKTQLDFADLMIHTNWKRGETSSQVPTALEVWKQMFKPRTSPSETTEAVLVRVFPELSGVARELEYLLVSSYSFWVNSFYSCEEDGGIGTISAQFSPAIGFTPEQMEAINAKADMPLLGQNIKGYAQFLYYTAD